jgi:hypothetical protein
MAQERLHVVPHDNGWAVKAENTSGTESTHSTQREAIDTARDLCRKKESDLVIHRLDGTIRNVYVYGESSNNSNDYEEENNVASTRNEHRTEPRERLGINDVASVGSRISWGAILAGAFVALSMMIALSVLCTALGLTVSERMSDRSLFYGAVICSLAVTLGSLFVGGYIVSCATAGETKSESIMYGIILWGAVFAILTALTAAGANMGYNAVMRVNNDGRQAVLPTQDRMEELGFDRAQVQRLQDEINRGTPQIDSSSVAWWTFAGIMLSMAAAVGGSIVGAGPTLFLRRTVTTTVPTGARATTA